MTSKGWGLEEILVDAVSRDTDLNRKVKTCLNNRVDIIRPVSEWLLSGGVTYAASLMLSELLAKVNWVAVYVMLGGSIETARKLYCKGV